MTPKQKAFIDEYLKDFNATQAAIRAGYSKNTAYSIGHENLKKPEIAEEVQRRVAERTMTADEVLIRLSEQARGEHARYIKPTGQVDLTKLVADGKQHLIKGTKWDRFGNLVVEFYDTQAALVHIGKALALFTDRTELTGADGGAMVIQLSWGDSDAGSD